jgi:hypothetical protein
MVSRLFGPFLLALAVESISLGPPRRRKEELTRETDHASTLQTPKRTVLLTDELGPSQNAASYNSNTTTTHHDPNFISTLNYTFSFSSPSWRYGVQKRGAASPHRHMKRTV